MNGFVWLSGFGMVLMDRGIGIESWPNRVMFYAGFATAVWAMRRADS